MRTTSQISQAAVGVTPWVPIDNSLLGFGLNIGCYVSSGASLTYKAQYTHDDLNRFQVCSITRAATVATLKLTAHGFTGTTDSVIVRGTGDSNLDGTYPVATIVDANTITYTVANSGATVAKGTAECVVVRVFDHATITAKTANFDGTITVPVTAVRLNLTIWTSGTVTMLLNMGRK
jgi:hypothetical protein